MKKQRGLVSLPLEFIIVGIALVGLSGWVLIEKNKLLKAEANLTTYKAELELQTINNEKLSDAVDQGNKSLNRFIEMMESANASLDELDEKYLQSSVKNEKLNSEVNSLRAGELNRAIEDPFNTGNSSNERISNSVFTIFDQTSREGEVTDNTETPTAANTSKAK